MIFLSIINHKHDHLIVSNPTLPILAQGNVIIIKSNTAASQPLKNFASEHGIILLDEKYGMGFGENNNYVFEYLCNNKIITNNDFFLVINPDVIISNEELTKLQDEINTINSDIYTINLFYDKNFLKPELSVRKFPTFFGPLKGLLNKDYRSDAYDKSKISQATNVEWAAGSFLIFKKQAYEFLGGFDKRFFMYFEDVDICRRAKKKGMLLTYFPNIKAIHKGAFNNRKIYSRHFYWYLMSYFIYHLKN